MSTTAEPPRVVACMPAWNARNFIEPVLESIAKQTYPNLHLLISDDASTDGTGEICEAFARTHERVTYMRQPVRLGWIGNVNALLARADGDIFFFAFHDDPLKPQYVQRLVEALHAHPRAVLAFADVEANGARWIYSALEGLADRAERAWHIVRREGHWWVPNRGLFRASAARQLAGMRPHIAGEFMADWPWLLRLSLLGEFVRVPEALVDKVWLDEGLSRVWRHSPWEHFGASLACSAAIRSAGFPLAQELKLHAHLLVVLCRSLWKRRSERLRQFAAR